jgi:hypothetical protein
MSYGYRDYVTRVRVRDVARLGAAVTLLALIAGVYLSAWSSLPLPITLACCLMLLGGWAVRHHHRSLRRMRKVRFHIDSAELRVERAGQAAYTIVTKDRVRAITFDDDEVIAIYDHGHEPVFRVGLGVLENGDKFWAQLRQWGTPKAVPRGRFSAPESSGVLLALTLFAGLIVYAQDPIGVLGLGLMSLAFLVWHMRVPWRHRHISPAARRILWVAACLAVSITARLGFVALSG